MSTINSHTTTNSKCGPSPSSFFTLTSGPAPSLDLEYPLSMYLLLLHIVKIFPLGIPQSFAFHLLRFYLPVFSGTSPHSDRLVPRCRYILIGVFHVHQTGDNVRVSSILLHNHLF